MNISEAAKKAEQDIYEQVVVCALSDGDRDRLRIRIQSAIDAVTAAKDAEIARLKEELRYQVDVVHKTNCEQIEADVGIKDKLYAERLELVEALKKAELKLIDTVGTKDSVRGMNEATAIIQNALKKVGAE